MTGNERPIFVDGIGHPLQQLERDYQPSEDNIGRGRVCRDVLALIAEVKRLVAALSAATRDLEVMTHQRDFWEQRYETQHRTVHRLEDTIAELREALSAATTERDEARERAGERMVTSDYGAYVAAEARAVAAEQSLKQTREALIELRAWAIASASQGVLDLINAALAAAAPATTPNETEQT